MTNRNSFKRNFDKIENKSTSIGHRIKKWIADKLNLSALTEATAKTTQTLKGLVKKIGLSFPTVEGGDFGKEFEAPDFDLQQIQNAYEADGYVRQAIDKYVDLIFKTGYEVTGQNLNAVEYIKARLAYMAETTGVPTEVLFQEIAENLIKYNNVIMVKARTNEKAALPPTGAIKGMDGFDPVGGYFILPTQTMKVKRDKFGVVKGWEQEIEEQEKPAKFKTQDIIHMYFKREPGKAFAYPSLLSVLDDVRALREMEERVLQMIYRHVNPLIHVSIGTKEFPGTPEEVEEGKIEVENMSVDGGIITTNRTEIKAIGTQNVVDANPYLKHFEKRVFTGLGVSETMMGRGDTSNRSTSDNQKEEAVDRVKAFQRIISIFVTNLIINELLREGGFDPLNNPDDKVYLMFKDPDIDSKIKQENHAIFKFQSNAITEDEMRKLLNIDPIPDSDRKKLHYTLYGQKDTTAETSNKNQPENQSGKKTSPKKTTNAVETLAYEYLDKFRFKLIKHIDSYYNGIEVEKDIINELEYIGTIIKNALKDSTKFNVIFNEFGNNILLTLKEQKTAQVAKETNSAVIDIFINEFSYILNNGREEN
jgi:hypothetical protein